MIVGSLAAAAHGTALVVYLHYFAKIVQVMGIPPDRPEDRFDRFKDVRATDVNLKKDTLKPTNKFGL
ncbi:hypothetical protein GH714_010124 [Hevea brasiliensis]|uniref:Uncharacterized protein n=1 Tax=Hevea brasiliensis TaxID=3981 RepID=A0A6A6MY20_HEVBR|nr:hypothetical protein GH714_010124 [Hevea brasiliensis]